MFGSRRSHAAYDYDGLCAYLAEHFEGAAAPIVRAVLEVSDTAQCVEPDTDDASTAGMPVTFDAPVRAAPPVSSDASAAPRTCAPRAAVPGFASAGSMASMPARPCAPRLDDLLSNLDEGFSPTLLHLIDERGLTDAQVYRRANVSRQLFSKIRKDPDYRPTKQTVLAFAVALGLTLEEARDLLARAGFALSHSSRSDVIVEYFLAKGPSDVMVVNQALYDYGEPLLGSA